MDSIITLNVGGRIFTTTQHTLSNALYKSQYFTQLLANAAHIPILKDNNGHIFIDRNPRLFEKLLDYMRDGDIDLEPPAITIEERSLLLREAKYYGIDSLITRINAAITAAATNTNSKDYLTLHVMILGDTKQIMVVCDDKVQARNVAEKIMAIHKNAGDVKAQELQASVRLNLITKPFVCFTVQQCLTMGWTLVQTYESKVTLDSGYIFTRKVAPSQQLQSNNATVTLSMQQHQS